MTEPAANSGDARPQLVSLVTPRHARVGLLGDPQSATEAWLILHGYGMTSRGILHWFAPALRPGRLLVAPEGLSRFYSERRGLRTVGASWMTREDREAEIADQHAYLDRVAARWLDGRHRVEVHGFSQGVATAARWVAASRAVDRLVGWGSPTPPDLLPGDYAGRHGDGPVVLVIGREDRYYAPAVIDADAERLRAGGVAVEVRQFTGGHQVDRGVLADLAG